MKRVLSTGGIANARLDDTCTQVRRHRKKSKRNVTKVQSVRSTDSNATIGDNNHFTTSASASEMSQLQKQLSSFR